MDTTVVGLIFSPPVVPDLHHFYRRDPERLDVPESLWRDKAFDDLLAEPDSTDKLAAIARRGWLDL